MRLALGTTEVMQVPLRHHRYIIMALEKNNIYLNKLLILCNFCCHQISASIHKITKARQYIGNIAILNKSREIIMYFQNSSLTHQIAHKRSLSQARINKILIVISNTSILNPGPKNTVSVFYQNVQGLIPFSNLADKCPNFDVTKIAELQCSINLNKPDIVILNETWLKSTILDTEIFSSEAYKVFRLDRSKYTHPRTP